ncbi:MAG: phosphodiester glycosidase family protein [Lachnospiraceae bacterium]|nr:phosphodiester glycosidase family protein [Lachnospiraceae bacterium]
MRKNLLFPIFYGILMTSFTVYVVLDTFVITRVYGAVEPTASAYTAEADTSETTASVTVETETSGTSGSSSSVKRSKKKSSSSGAAERASAETAETTAEAAVSTENTYQDENISVTLTEYTVNDTAVYVADVTLSSAEYLKTALAQGLYGKNVTESTSDMAEDNNAILAINGDYYGAQEKGYVLRNGVLYRSTAAKNQEDLVIYADGSFQIINESEVTAEELLADGAVQILSFGPALVTDGEIAVSTTEEVGQAKSSNPRTAIGVIDELHYIFVVSDGRTDESEGLSLYELASFMESLGAETAYNLDGGGSSTMVFNGTLINNPTSTGNSIRERSVSDIVYIGY